MTPSGEVVQLGELVGIERAVGPSRIQRIDGRRTLTLNVNPPEGMSLENMKVITSEVEPAIMAMMPTDGAINYGGARMLKGAIASMADNFSFVVLLLLLMAGLFKSLKDSVLVVLSIPLATVGGDCYSYHEHLYLPAHGPVNHDWLYYFARACSKQCHFTRASDS